MHEGEKRGFYYCDLLNNVAIASHDFFVSLEMAFRVLKLNLMKIGPSCPENSSFSLEELSFQVSFEFNLGIFT